MKNKFLSALSLAMIMAILLTSLALADTVTPDSDTLTIGDQTTRDLGNVAPGAVLTPEVSFVLVCAGNNHVDNAQSVSIAFTLAGSTVPAGGSLSALTATAGATSGSDLGIPAGWPDDGNNNCAGQAPIGDNGNSIVTITAPTAPGTYTYSVKYNATPTPAGSNDPSSISGSVFAQFTLTVVSNASPTIAVNNVTKEGNTTGGWTLAFADIGSASDAEDGTPSVSCTPAIGSVLPLGTNSVSCTATDSGGLTATDSGMVTVVDTTKPTLSLPQNQEYEGNTTGGYNGAYAGATASDIVDANPAVVCTPVSGSLLALGANTINCTATDASGNSSSGSFTVTVVDTTKPSITCPSNIVGTVGQSITLGLPTVSDIVDASPTVGNNAPISFGPGVTTVTWTATDHSGNSASCSQTVTLTYKFLGFFQPVDNLPTVNKAKAGQAIPFKWALQDANGNFVSDLSTAAGYGYQVGSCTSALGDAIESYDTTGTSGLRYDPLANQFIFTSQTQKSWAGSCKTFILRLSDGTTHQANFNFVK